MTEISMGALSDAVTGLFRRDQAVLDSVLAREEMVDELCRAVTAYTMTWSRGPLPKALQNKPLLWLHIMSDIERICDHAENIAELRESFPEKEAILTPESIAELNALRELTAEAGVKAIAVMAESPDADLPALMRTKDEINRQVDTLLSSHAARITSGESTPVGGILYVEIVTNLRRVCNHLRNAAVSAGSGEPELTRIRRKLQDTE